MTNMTGHFKGQYTVQTQIALQDVAGHQLALSEVRGSQTASDPNFDNSKHCSCGTSDLTHGEGHQRGYFVNEHQNGDKECGTFEGKISNSNGQITSEGTWKYTHGTGKFAGLTGHGKYRGRLVSASEIEMNWEGSYQMAAGKRAA